MPKEQIRLQGHPQVASGEWRIEHAVDENGVPVTNNKAEIVETNQDLAEAQLKEITAGETYFISYRVQDEFGCEGVSNKSIKINSRPTTVVLSGGLKVAPSDVLCIKDDKATIVALQNPGKITLSNADSDMYDSDFTNGIQINPSKGKPGSHTAVYTIVQSGCKYSEEVSFEIVNPISISSFILPKKQFCEKDDPVVIEVDAVVPTKGSITIVNQNGETKLASTDIANSPMFNPAWGEGIYTITYFYNDG